MFTFEYVLIFFLLMGIAIYKYLHLTWILPQGALTAWDLARVLLDLLYGVYAFSCLLKNLALKNCWGYLATVMFMEA